MSRALISKRFEQSLLYMAHSNRLSASFAVLLYRRRWRSQQTSYDRNTARQKNYKKNPKKKSIKKCLVLSFPNDSSNLFCMWLIRTVFLRALRFFFIEMASVFRSKVIDKTKTKFFFSWKTAPNWSKPVFWTSADRNRRFLHFLLKNWQLWVPRKGSVTTPSPKIGNF